MTCSSIRSLAFASVSLCSISAGIDVCGDQPSAMTSDPALAIDDQDLADAGTAVAQQMQQGELPIDGGTTAETWGGTRGQNDDNNGKSQGFGYQRSRVSDGSDPGDEDPRELEPA